MPEPPPPDAPSEEAGTPRTSDAVGELPSCVVRGAKARTPATGGRTRRETVLSPYEEHRDYVLAVLARRCGWLDPADREGLFHDAYAVFLHKQRDGQLDATAMRPPQVRAYLTQTALNKAMDEGKRAGRRRSVSLDDEDLGIEPPDPARTLDEQLASRFEDAKVREIVARLPERQQLVIKLRYFFNRTPQEIQRHMQITERVYRRELERATRQLAESFALLRDGSFCQSRRSLILAYVTGVAGPNRRLEARRHLESCPGCASWVLEMRAVTQRAAAALPVPALALSVHHWAGRRARSMPAAIRDRLVELATGLRDHGLRVLLRVDSSRVAAFSGVRPSAVAMMISGCVAAGSTATFCVVHGLPAPLSSLVGSAPRQHARQHHHRRRLTQPSRASSSSASLAPATAPAITTPPGTPYRRSTSTTSRARHSSAASNRTVTGVAARRARAARVERATAPEFGIGGGGASSPATVPSTTPPAASSGHGAAVSGSGGAAAPSKPLPEFDP